MNEAVLLYNYKGDRLKAVRNTLLSMKIPVKTAAKKEFSKPIGTLFGLKDIEPLPDDSPNFDDELMVIKDFPHLTFNVMLKKTRKLRHKENAPHLRPNSRQQPLERKQTLSKSQRGPFKRQ